MKGILRNDTATGGPNPIQTGASSVGGTLGNTVGNTANTGGNLASNVGQTLGNTASNLGQTARDFGQTGSVGGLARDSASTVGQSFGDTGTTTGNLAKNTFGTVGGTLSDTGSTVGSHSSGSMGQGLAYGLERTGSGVEGVGNVTGGLASSSTNTLGNAMGAPSSSVGSGYSSNLQSGYQSGNLQPGFSGSSYQSGNLQQGFSGSSYQSGNLQPGFSGSNLQSGNLQQGFSGSGLQSGYSDYTSGTGLTTGNWAQEIRTAPTVLMEKVEKPLIVRETVLPQEKIEVQPIIHREREQLEVHEVTQPMHERDIAPTNVRTATLPAQVRADIRESDANFQTQYRAASNRYASDVETLGVQREFYNKQPILEEHISKKIIEEVQPVLYKETIAPTLIEETQPVYERIVEAPVMFEETRATVDLGTKMLSQPIQTPLQTQPMQTQFTHLTMNEPSVIHKETYITKEVFADPTHKANVATGAPYKHII